MPAPPSSPSVRGYEVMLRRLLRRLTVLGLGAPFAVQACSSGAAKTTGADSGAEDGSMTQDADPSSDATAQDTSSSPGDAGSSSGSVFPTCSDASVGAPYYADAGAGVMYSTDGAASACRYLVELSCPLYEPLAGGCYLPNAICLELCTLGTPTYGCDYDVNSCVHGVLAAQPGQPVNIECELCGIGGRRPLGLVAAARSRSGSAVGRYFASSCRLEAASVVAFRRLAGELRAHAAPRALVSVARRSARDEIRHARMTGALARRYGAAPLRSRVKPKPIRDLERVARENAVEGCVRETFGAVVACWQSTHAQDDDVRRCMALIAADETRHAALAWAVARWAEGELSSEARTRIRRARRSAVRRLARELDCEPPAALVRAAGIPRRAAALALLAEVERALWA